MPLIIPYLKTKWILTIFILGLLTSKSTDANGTEQSIIKKRIHQKIASEVAIYVQRNHFHLSVQITFPQSQNNQDTLPYVPSTSQSQPLKIDDLSSLSDLISTTESIIVTIKISPDYKEQTRDFIDQFLRERFLLGTNNRSDQIRFEDLLIDRPPSDTERMLELELEKNRNELSRTTSELSQALSQTRSLQGKIDTVQKDHKKNLKDLKNDHNLNLDTLKKQLTELQEQNSKIQKEKSQLTFINQYKEFIITGLVILGIIIASLLVALSVRAFGGYLYRALEYVSKSLDKSISQFSKDDNFDRGQTVEAEVTSSKQANEQNNDNWNYDSLEKQLDSLINDIASLLKTVTNDTIGNYIQNHLSANKIELVVCSLEIIGREVSSQIFHILSPPQKMAIFNFMHKGTFSRPKTQLMIHAAEMLKTHLLGSTFSAEEKDINNNVKKTLERLDFTKLEKLLRQVSPNQLIRVLFYYSAEEVSKILNHFAQDNQTIAEKIVDAIAQIPEGEKLGEEDTYILEILTNLNSDEKDSAYSQYLGFLKKILDESDDSVVDRLSQKLQDIEPMRQALQNRISSVTEFIYLNSEVKEEILSRLSMQEVSLLMSNFEEDQNNNILELFTKDEKEIIDSESKKLVNLAQYKVKKLKKQANSKVISAMRNLVKDLSLDDIREHPKTITETKKTQKPPNEMPKAS